MAAVGLTRQAVEQAGVRRGSRAPARASLQVPPREGPLERRLAAWVPDPPRSRWGRVAATAWSSPLTLLGMAVGAVGGGQTRWDERFGCWVVEGGGGGSARFLRRFGYAAHTLGQTVISRHRPTPTALLAHEAAHCRQSERLGPAIVPVYLWYLARRGYRDHPLERAARLAAARAAPSVTSDGPSTATS